MNFVSSTYSEPGIVLGTEKETNRYGGKKIHRAPVPGAQSPAGESDKCTLQ